MTTLNEFIEKLSNIKNELGDKEICVVAQNGIVYSPDIKFELNDQSNVFDLSKENIKRILLV